MGATSTFTITEPQSAPASGDDLVWLKVFKVGTFKNSRGEQKTWTAGDLKKMVEHFTLLRDQNIFTKPPVRVDHTESAKDVVGWVGDLRVADGFLEAGVRFTEQDAREKYDRGTYGPRSSEIGEYETNGDEPKTYFPVYMGLAFVDIPAVEGLHSKGHGQQGSEFRIEGDAPVTTFKLNGADEQDHARVQAYIADLEKRPAAAHVFKINGQPVGNDPEAVQSHIDALEGALDEGVKAARTAFVKSLADGKKITAPQVDSLTELAVGMDDAQFAKFQASYEAAPMLGVLASHTGGSGSGTGSDNGGGDSPAARELAVVTKQVDMLRRTMTPEQLAKTSAYVRLQKLETAASSR